ncbi:MAG: carboxylating nicotinate-nucleotide diphosphorylase [Ferruginibacter sp.]
MQKADLIQKLITDALLEDIGDGDHSTLSTIGLKVKGRAVLKIKEDGILAGLEFAQSIFNHLQPTAVIDFLKEDGDKMVHGDVAFEVHADAAIILQAERLVLNCMQRMSGIATLTRKYVDRLEPYKTRLLDTRKTTPNFRIAEKEAVRIGGGTNHRFGLYDMIMLKDNHIDFCGGIEKAIAKAYNYVQVHKPGIKIEVETRSLDDVKKVMKAGKINRIMLDNFSPSDIIKALQIINGEYETEASGGIHYDNLEAYAETSVDFISSGAIIHQARSLDLSLKAIIE